MSESPYAHDQLKSRLDKNPADWEARKLFARYLYDRGETMDAAELIWQAPEIPTGTYEIAFAARLLAKGTPRRAIRLLNAILEQNRHHPAENLELANALLHHGMVLQAARFYGAAIEADPSNEHLNPDLEHFMLWVDDREKLWKEFQSIRDQLDELPWMTNGRRQTETLAKTAHAHRTPIQVPQLRPAPGEEPGNLMYVQSPYPGDDPTPPPAITAPLDRQPPVAAKAVRDPGSSDFGRVPPPPVEAPSATDPSANPPIDIHTEKPQPQKARGLFRRRS